MSILVDQNTRVLMQGITGSAGSFHAGQMLDYGTQLVAGVTPGKGGTEFQDEVPIFNTVADAVKHTGANASVIFVPPPFAGDAILESADAGVPLIIAFAIALPTDSGEAQRNPFLNAAVIGVLTKPGLIVTTRTPLE